MTNNELIAKLQAEAAVMPGGGENPVRFKTVEQVSDSKLVVKIWEIDDVLGKNVHAEGALITAK